MNYDVVVVGGGPAGAIAAKTAAKAGLKTLLIEKRSSIGDPVRCGEGLPYSICEEFCIKPKEYFNKTNYSDYISPDGKVLRLKTHSYIVDRRRFDKDLVNEAEDDGAMVWLKARAAGLERKNEIFSINVKKDGKFIKINPKVIVAADGIESAVARMAGVPIELKLEDIGSAAAAVVEGINIEKNVVIQSFLKGVPLGYFWIFPKSENTANIGVGWIMKQGVKLKPVDLLHSFLKKVAFLKEGNIKYYTSGGVPTTLRMENLVNRNILFTGDAAHLSNPAGGDGVPQAMLSGRLAAEVLTEGIAQDDLKILKKYDSRWGKLTFGKNNMQDTQYGLYIIQNALLSLPMQIKEEALEDLWILAVKNNQYPFNLINTVKNKKLRLKMLEIIMQNKRLRSWAATRFFSLGVKKLRYFD